MISASGRSKAVGLIDEAITNGARLFKACAELRITERTYYRWIKLNKTAGSYEDLRPEVEHPEPANKLSHVECQISTHESTAQNQVWMRDITYLNGPVKGMFYYPYLISDLFSRDILGWEVCKEESAMFLKNKTQ